MTDWRPLTVPLPGATLRGEARGIGKPLVLIHGLGGNRGDWDRVIAALPPDLPLLRYDLRGCGQSSAEPGVAFSHADDLLALLDHVDLPQADLCGVSMGGAIALNFALDHPARVGRLALISPGLVGWEFSEEWKGLWHPILIAARCGDMEKARHLWWEHPLFATTRTSEAAADLRRSIWSFDGRQWVADDQSPALPDLDRLGSLETETLLLTGDADLPDFRLIASLLEAVAPNLRRVDIPGAGHLLHMERPGQIARILTDFLSA